jgi:hypothetical protein
VLDPQQLVAGGAAPPREVFAHLAVGHQADELGNGGAARGERRHAASVPHHRHAIADAGDLLQAVGDVDDGRARGAQALDGGEELVDLRGREGGGRLVHDEDAHLLGEGLRHLDHLLMGDAQLAHGTGGSTLTPSSASRRAAAVSAARRSRTPQRPGSLPRKMFAAAERGGTRFSSW